MLVVVLKNMTNNSLYLFKMYVSLNYKVYKLLVKIFNKLDHT